MAISLFFDLYDWLGSAALAFGRVAPVFFILPFLNGSVLTGVVRMAVITLVAVALWPHAIGVLPPFAMGDYLALIAREIMVGLLLGCLLALPFWIFHGLGSIIDNQRGATLSSTMDPVNGIDTSELANFFNMFAAAVYLQGGGLELMLTVLTSSYRLCDPLGDCSPALPPVLGVINQTVSEGMVLSSPVVAAMLLSEVVLGLLSRFAPQMNAFSISLTVKSGVALLILLIYFSPILPDKVAQLSLQPDALPRWLSQPEESGSHVEQDRETH